jgi:hypothetical protein
MFSQFVNSMHFEFLRQQYFGLKSASRISKFFLVLILVRISEAERIRERRPLQLLEAVFRCVGRLAISVFLC